MKIAVVKVVSEAVDTAAGSFFWDPKEIVRSEDHDVQVTTVELTTWENEIRVLAKKDFGAFVVSGSDDPMINTAAVNIVRLIQGLDHVVFGPSTDFAGMDGHYSPVSEHEGSEFTEHKLHILAVDMDTDIVIFGPAVSSPNGSIELVIDKELASSTRAKVSQELSRDMFKGTSGLLRIDLQVTTSPLLPYVVHIDQDPRIFATKVSSLEDELVKLLVPGGHSAILDLLISNRLASWKDLVLGQKVVDTYATYAPNYDEEVSQFPYFTKLQGLTSAFDWSGTVLDLGCGTGLLGELIYQKSQKFQITGVDLSPDMLGAPAIAARYESRVRIEPVQRAIMRPETYDHVACFGTVVYLSEVDFTAFLTRMFMIAQKSVSFDIEDVSPEYLEKSAKDSLILPSYNHTAAFRRFQIPAGWRIVHDEYGLLYHDYHETDSDIFDTMIRIEKVSN